MYPIVRKEVLADKIILMEVKAPRVSHSCLPGQFIIAKIDEDGERIPLTICDYDREKETVTIVVQTIGASTERMAYLEEGDSFTTGMHFKVEVRMPLLMDADFEEVPAIQAQVRQYEYGAAKDFIEEWNLGMTVQDFLDDYLPGLDDDDDMSSEWLQFLDDWNDSKTVDFICDVTLVVQPSGLPGVCEIRAVSRLEADGDTEEVLRTDAVCSSKEQFLGRGRKAVLDALNALGGFVFHQ